METVLVAAAVLACPIGMGAMMWFMGKGMRKDKPAAEQQNTAADLRAEHDRLGAEIERLDHPRNGRDARPAEHAR
jgi:hypothetical protein